MREYTESLSPFIQWTPAERAPISDRDLAQTQDGGVLLELLRDNDAMVERLLDRRRTQAALLFSVVVILVTSSVSALLMAWPWADRETLWLAAVAAPTGVIASLAASMGPIYAAGILYAVRLPLARVASVLLCSVAAGTVILASLSPLVCLLWKLDPEWAGPLAIVGVFGVAAITAGVKARGLLRGLAEAVNPDLAHDKDTRWRLAAFCRVALLLLSLPLFAGAWSYLANM